MALCRRVSYLYALALLTVYALFLPLGGYERMMEGKYRAFLLLSLGYVLAMTALGAWKAVRWREPMCLAALAYLALTALSAALSPYGTAVLLEEVGRVIAPGGAGVTISSQSGWRMPALTAEQDLLLATTPTEKLLSIDFLQPENIRDTLHAYQMAKRCNEKRVTAQAVEWGKRGARLNDIAPGIIVTPLALDEFNGPRGGFYKNMFAKCPAGRPGTADEVANVAELLMSDKGAFITGSTFLIDGGATASYFYGPLRPEKA